LAVNPFFFLMIANSIPHASEIEIHRSQEPNLRT
jgi:hypothetical protein